MKLKFIKSDWGMERFGSFRDRIERYAAAGYQGVEAGFPGLDPHELLDILQQFNMQYIAMVFARDERELEGQLEVVRQLNPMLVNCHLGRDHFGLERGLALLRVAMDLASDLLPCEMLFETHRQTLLYSPWATGRYLDELPNLRLTADFSHFTCVAETDLESIRHAFPLNGNPHVITSEARRDDAMLSLLNKAIAASRHIHARVGHAQGPQVANPCQGDGLIWTQRFERWWDDIIRHCELAGYSSITINPEFGPAPYAPTDPATGKPFIDIWEVSLWLCDRFRSRWRTAEESADRP